MSPCEAIYPNLAHGSVNQLVELAKAGVFVQRIADPLRFGAAPSESGYTLIEFMRDWPDDATCLGRPEHNGPRPAGRGRHDVRTLAAFPLGLVWLEHLAEGILELPTRRHRDL